MTPFSKRSFIIPLLSGFAAILAIVMTDCHKAPTSGSEATEVASDTRDDSGAAAVIEYGPSEASLITDRPSKTLVIDFNATWCGPCREFKPVFHAVAKEYGSKAAFVSVDIDQNPDIANRFQVNCIPTIIVIKPDGTVKRAEGYMSPDALKTLVNS